MRDPLPPERRLVRPYVLTAVHSGASPEMDLDVATLIVACALPTPGMGPEQADILRLCRVPLSVAEIAAHLGLPLSAVSVVLEKLLDAEEIEARPPVPIARVHDPALLQAVMDGIAKL